MADLTSYSLIGKPLLPTSGEQENSYYLHLDSMVKRHEKSPVSSQEERPLTDGSLAISYDRHPLKKIPMVVFPFPILRTRELFIPLQSFEGYVVSRGEDSFQATLIDKTQGGGELEAEFPLEEVSLHDRSLVVPGAIFYWDIGYFEDNSGQRHRTSIIQFRRLPAWTSKEISESKERAQKLRDEIGWK